MTEAEKIFAYKRCKLIKIKLFAANMRFIAMFISAVCILFLIKLRWSKKKSLCILDSLLAHPSSIVGQIFSSSASPAQSSPPFAGGGLVQVLIRFFEP